MQRTCTCFSTTYNCGFVHTCSLENLMAISWRQEEELLCCIWLNIMNKSINKSEMIYVTRLHGWRLGWSTKCRSIFAASRMQKENECNLLSFLFINRSLKLLKTFSRTLNIHINELSAVYSTSYHSITSCQEWMFFKIFSWTLDVLIEIQIWLDVWVKTMLKRKTGRCACVG